MSGAKKQIKISNKSRNVWLNVNQSTRNDFNNVSNVKSITDSTLPLSGVASSGLVLSVHPVWPELPHNQSELFFECTLFLYSVLALFLQYLNLYKTLWWLPKSHWHTTMKFYLINPYLLSCIGLLLGMRVTKCFWITISEKSDEFLKCCKGWMLAALRITELSVRIFLMATVLSSFFFSFSRIFAEFGFKALLYFVYPFCIYLVFFYRQVFHLFRHFVFCSNASFFSLKIIKEILYDFSQLFHTKLVDLDSVVHLCSNVLEESKILLADFDTRFKCCVFTGILTSYFAILMPRAFIPEKSVNGESQFMLIDDIWVMELCVIVALTGFLLYATFLFPIQYFDLMHRCVTHLGYWKKLRHSRVIEETAIEYDEKNKVPVLNGTLISFRGEYYQAQSSLEIQSVAAEPGNEDHLRIYRIAADPVQLVSYVFTFQLLLVGLQFWALILSTDWQKIVTLVLLMFANYLLLAKIFKDRIIIGRIYKPSSEDLYLATQLQNELKQFHQSQAHNESATQKHTLNKKVI